MILEGNERAYGAELARHLLNPRDNDHVTVHAVEGFLAQDLFGAFAEAEAIATGTRCKKYLFSLSLSPPPLASVSVATFEATIATVERELGLSGQPKAVVFHEKNGRRHAHCVWSKVDAGQMKAINLSHYKRKLFGLSRDLYLAHEWDMPDGFKQDGDARTQNYSRAEAQQAKRERRDPEALKAMFQACWVGSDNRQSFEAALRDQGYILARGSRRGFVAVDANGKVWSLSRWTGVRPKELRTRLGPETGFPSVADVQAQLSDLKRPPSTETDRAFETQRSALVERQRAERAALITAQRKREEERLRTAKRARPKGIRAAFLKVTGRFDATVQRLQIEAAAAKQADRAEQDRLIERHLAERRKLDQERQHAQARKHFNAARRDPRQTLIQPKDDIPYTTDVLRANPGHIVEYLSHTRATFSRVDVLRALAKRIDDPMQLQSLSDAALASPDVMALRDDGARRFTTREYQKAVATLEANAAQMAGTRGVAVDQAHITSAMRRQDKQMQRAFDGQLSGEQRAALQHVLSGQQLTSVVGLAGAGKSTMLATARDAWERQGLTVHGAALAGKAADGLESASGIKSRTLASLETAWQNGHEPIARNDVLVLDEAGMLGTRQMARVTSKLDDIGAKLVLVGDPDQLQPIEAGTPFRDLVEKHGAARLTEIHRQRADWQKQASKDLAVGNVPKAVAAYAKRNTVSTEETPDNAIEALTERYAMDTATSDGTQTRLAFAHRRKDVHALNQSIRAAIRDQHAPPETLYQTDTGPRAMAAGDRIVFGRNDKELGVKNGMLGTVVEADDGSIRVDLDGDVRRRMNFDPQQYRSFDHGYAVTIHKSQGATVDQSYVLASRTMDDHLAYVALTRHRDDMRLYVSHEDRPKWALGIGRSNEREQKRNRSGPSLG